MQVTEPPDEGWWQTGPLAALMFVVAACSWYAGWVAAHAWPRIAVGLSNVWAVSAAAVALTLLLVALLWGAPRFRHDARHLWAAAPAWVKMFVVGAIATTPPLLLWHETRGSTIVAWWQLILAGAAAWWYFEQRSEPVQRQAWLRRNADYVKSVLGDVCRAVNTTAILTLGFDMKVLARLSEAPSRAERRDVAMAVRSNFERQNLHIADGAMRTNSNLRTVLPMQMAALEVIASSHPDVFSHLTDLQAALREYRQAHGWAVNQLDSQITGNDSDWRADLFKWIWISRLGLAAVDFGERCSDALLEAGALPVH
jgi:hypothetical protein